MAELDLAEAVRRAKDGDEQSFGALWRSLQPAVLRYARVLVGQAAEDVAAEAWLQVAKDLPSFRGGPERFRAWLFAIVRNRATDERRRIGRRRDHPNGLDVPADVTTAGSDEEALSWLATERVLALIATLPRDQAEAVVLRVVAGLDTRQAAAILGKRPGAVRVAAHRGLRRLAERLGEMPDPVGRSVGHHRTTAGDQESIMPAQRALGELPAVTPPSRGVTG